MSNSIASGPSSRAGSEARGALSTGNGGGSSSYRGSTMYGRSQGAHSRHSASPTRFYRARAENAYRVGDKLMELNAFIYRGIDKFLDKQAVRDLITAYDDEDLYGPGGIEGEQFGRSIDTDDEDDGDDGGQAGVNHTTDADVERKFGQAYNRAFQHHRQQQRRGGILETVRGLIKFKVFNVQRRHGQHRPDMEKMNSIYSSLDNAYYGNNRVGCCG